MNNSMKPRKQKRNQNNYGFQQEQNFDNMNSDLGNYNSDSVQGQDFNNFQQDMEFNGYEQAQSFNDYSGNQGVNNYNNIPNNYGMPTFNPVAKKKFNPLFIIIPVVAIILVVGLIFVLKGRNNDINVTPPVETDHPVVTPPVETDHPVVTPPVETPVQGEIVEGYSYENKMLGIKFNFGESVYAREDTVAIFNTLKSIIPSEERDNFNIYSDKLNSSLNAVRLVTGNNDGLYITINIIPFEITKETTILKTDGSIEFTSEQIDVLSLEEEELLEKYDEQIKTTLEDAGCTIMDYSDSQMVLVGGMGEFKAIMSKRTYSGLASMTTSTGIADVLQYTIPLGRNAIVVSAITDGRPIDIDKSIIIDEIVHSFVVTTEKPPVEEVEEPDIDEEVEYDEEGNPIEKESDIESEEVVYVNIG